MNLIASVSKPENFDRANTGLVKRDVVLIILEQFQNIHLGLADHFIDMFNTWQSIYVFERQHLDEALKELVQRGLAAEEYDNQMDHKQFRFVPLFRFKLHQLIDFDRKLLSQEDAEVFFQLYQEAVSVIYYTQLKSSGIEKISGLLYFERPNLERLLSIALLDQAPIGVPFMLLQAELRHRARQEQLLSQSVDLLNKFKHYKPEKQSDYWLDELAALTGTTAVLLIENAEFSNALSLLDEVGDMIDSTRNPRYLNRRIDLHLKKVNALSGLNNVAAAQAELNKIETLLNHHDEMDEYWPQYWQQQAGIFINYCMDFEKAKSCYLNMAKWYKDRGDFENYAMTLCDLASLSNFSANTVDEECEQYMKDALELAGSITGSEVQIDLLMAMAIYQISTQAYEQAKIYLKQGLQFAIEHEQHLNIADAFQNLGVAENATGQLENAFDYFEKAVEFYSKLGYEDAVAETYLDMADVQYKLADYDCAALWNKRAILILRNYQESASLYDAYINLASILIAQNKLKSAEQLLMHVLNIVENRQVQRAKGDALRCLGDIAIVRKQCTKAFELFSQSLHCYLEANDLSFVQNLESYMTRLSELCEEPSYLSRFKDMIPLA
ncbi:MAG: tetratricopeptide repeat protein, partial [Proteobacteria bacterium]|nr:tetratricopeptide repeat protein [Pseudomonadota bacterium]